MSSRPIPRRALALDLAVGDKGLRGRRGREVLIVGEVPAGLRAELLLRRASLTDAPNISGAFESLGARPFDVVVVDPYVDGRGLDFVSAIKEGAAEQALSVATLYGARGDARFLLGVQPPARAVLDAARTRHRLTPFVVLPLDDSATYSVVVLPPDATFIEDGRDLPLATAILSVDAGRLLGSAGPMA